MAKKVNSAKKSDIYSEFEPMLIEQSNKIAINYFHKEYMESLTFKELLVRVDAAFQRLSSMGLKEGDRVAILIETSPCWVVTFLALMRLRITVVLIDPTLPLEDIVGEVNYADVRCMTVSTYANSKSIVSAFPDMPLIIADQDYVLVDKSKSPELLPRSIDAISDVAIILFTSGTSGHYKAVMLTHENFLHVATCKKIVDMTDNTFTILPCYHIAGLTTFSQVLLAGGKTINLIEKIEPELILHVFQAARPVIFLGVPRFLELFHMKINNKIKEQSFAKRSIAKILMKLCGIIKKNTPFNPGKKLFHSVHQIFGGQLQLFFSGGAPLNSKIQDFFEALGFDVMLGYGLSETSGCVVLTDIDNKITGVTGKPMKGCQLKIYSPDEQGIGEICIKSPSVMKGYYKNQEATDACIKSGWFHTGDIGHIDSHENLTVDGRLKELIVTACGKKATPYEIEHHYLHIPGVSELVVVGVPNLKLKCDEVYGAVIVDKNKLSPGQTIEQLQFTIQEAFSLREGNLPSQFRIQHIEFFDDLPRTSGMKKTIRPKIVKEIQQRKKGQHTHHEPLTEEKIDAELKKVINTLVDAIAKVTSLPPSEIDFHHHFTDYGIDSLQALEIIQKLREAFSEQIISPDKLLKNPTIIEYARDIVKNIHAPYQEEEHTTSIVPPRKSPSPAQIPIPVEELPKSDVIFVTGGTGVLGGYFAKLLLCETDKTVYLLTRAKTQEMARKNLVDILTIYDTPPELLKTIDDRFHLVLGDVSLPRLGLSEKEYTDLTQKVDTVIHGAAVVSLHGLYDSLVPINVLGTKHMIDFTLETKQKYLVYVSSYSMMGDILFDKNAEFTEQDFDRNQRFPSMGYQQTKFEAELLVREASSLGLKWNIVRPGDIFGDSQTGSYPLLLPQLTGIFYDILRTVLYTKLAVDTQVYFDITPVDYVARGLFYLGLKHPSLYGTYHLTNPTPVPYTNIIKIIQNLGYPVELLSIDEYMRRVHNKQIMFEGQPYSSRALELLQFNPKLASAKESTHISSEITSKVLKEANIICPLIDEKLLKTYFTYCQKTGYLINFQ